MERERWGGGGGGRREGRKEKKRNRERKEMGIQYGYIIQNFGITGCLSPILDTGFSTCS